MVDAGVDGAAKDRDRRAAILRRPEDAGPGELHRPEADAVHRVAG